MNSIIKVSIVCSLTICNLLCNAVTNQAIIDKATQYDLDLSCKEKKSLREIIKVNTQTGRNIIDSSLLQPTNSLDTLHKRQEIVHFLIEQKQLYTELKKHLTAVAPHESALSINTHDPIVQESLKKVYFSISLLDRFNTSPYALDIAYVMHITGLCLPLAEYLVLHAGFSLFSDHQDNHDHSTCGHSHGFYSFHALLFGVHTPAFIDMVHAIKQRAILIKILQCQLIHLAAYVKAAKKIYYQLHQNQFQILNVAAFEKLNNFFSDQQTCSKDMQHLLKLLKEPTFLGQACLYSHVGNVLAAYKLYTKVYDEFSQLTDALGEIDMYVSVAELMINQTDRAPWCFVTFKESTQPSMVAKSMRHLFVSEKVSKSWDFASGNSLHTFVTGDNGSGKSTYINGIGHALILAQTFGVAPAQVFEITPFSHICTYRFVEDNIAGGTSRFYAECARIESILNTVNEDSGLSCVLLDEPFTSTNAQKGSDFLKDALCKLYEKNNVLSLTASHYNELSSITKEHIKTKHLHLSIKI